MISTSPSSKIYLLSPLHTAMASIKKTQYSHYSILSLLFLLSIPFLENKGFLHKSVFYLSIYSYINMFFSPLIVMFLESQDDLSQNRKEKKGKG